MRVLVGYDGSVDADGALHDLQGAGLPSDTQVLVAAFAAPWEPIGPDGLMPEAFVPQFEEFRARAGKEALALAEKGARYLRKHNPRWKVKAEGQVQAPVQGLLDIAERWKPGLIVLGSHGRTALGRMLLGSVSQAVLHRAGCSVRITRPRLRARAGAPRLLLGVDGSIHSDALVESVASRAWPKGTEIRVLGVLELRPSAAAGWAWLGVTLEAELDEARVDFLEMRAAAAAEKLSRKGLRAIPSILTGDPRSTLIQEAKTWGADCLFVGSRGAGALERFLLGSVSSTTASHAPCTVEVVRAAASAAGKAKARAAVKKTRKAAAKARG